MGKKEREAKQNIKSESSSFLKVPKFSESKLLRNFPVIISLLLLLLMFYLGFNYVPGKFTVGLNYISRQGVVNGTDGGFWLIGTGIASLNFREISTGFEMVFESLNGILIVSGFVLFLILQIVLVIKRKKRN